MLTGNPTKQEVFDFGLAAIIKQGKPSWNPETRACMYRGPEGTKCVVGHMIPDDFVFGEYVSASIHGLCSSVELPESLAWMRLHSMRDFLNHMQKCHDWAASEPGDMGFVQEFKNKMQNLAKHENLIYKEPE